MGREQAFIFGALTYENRNGTWQVWFQMTLGDQWTQANASHLWSGRSCKYFFSCISIISRSICSRGQ